MELGQALADLRSRAELSQRELAERVGVAVMSISSIERGHRTPSVDTLTKWVEACGGGAVLLLPGDIEVMPAETAALVRHLVRADADTRGLVGEVLDAARQEGPGSTALLQLRLLTRTLMRR
jgi:transcriptional regulator with XRE-family HTH domain